MDIIETLSRFRKMNTEMRIRLIFLIFTFINAIFIILTTLLPNVDTYGMFSRVINLIVTMVFIAEYIWNIIVAKKKWKYILSLYGLIQLLAIIPVAMIELQGIRLLKVITDYVLFKSRLNRHREADYGDGIIKIIKKQRGILIWSLVAVLLIIMASAFIIFSIEHPLQPDVFGTPIDAVWWAFQTVSTVGYGDIVPISIPGRIIAMILSIAGIATFSIPTTLISTRYIQQTQRESVRRNLKHTMEKTPEALTIEHLERLEKLLASKTISVAEFNVLKERVLKRRN